MQEFPPCKLSQPSDGNSLFLWKHFCIRIILCMLMLNGNTTKASLASPEKVLENISTKAGKLIIKNDQPTKNI